MVAVLAATVGVVVVRGGSGGNGYRDVGTAEVAAIVDDADVWVVNVHTPYEGELPGTDAFVPYTEVGGSGADLPEDRAAEIVVYCKTGRMSAQAANSLVDLGYTNVSNMVGGFDQWQSEGRGLITRS